MGTAIALAVAVASAVGGVLTLAFKALSAERRAGEQKARADVLDANHTIAARDLADTAAQLKDAQGRLDDLANELAQMAAAMPADGAYWRLLQKANARRAASSDSPGTVHHNADSDAGLSTDLLRPGD